MNRALARVVGVFIGAMLGLAAGVLRRHAVMLTCCTRLPA